MLQVQCTFATCTYGVVILYCSVCVCVLLEVKKVEMKVKPQEVVGKKRVAHEAKHLEVNVENLDSLNSGNVC